MHTINVQHCNVMVRHWDLQILEWTFFIGIWILFQKCLNFICKFRLSNTLVNIPLYGYVAYSRDAHILKDTIVLEEIRKILSPPTNTNISILWKWHLLLPFIFVCFNRQLFSVIYSPICYIIYMLQFLNVLFF